MQTEVKINDVKYKIKSASLDKGIETVEFFISEFGDSVISSWLKIKTLDSQMSRKELVKELLNVIKKDVRKDKIKKLLNKVVCSDHIENFEGIDKINEKHGLGHLLKLASFIITELYLGFFLIYFKEKKYNPEKEKSSGTSHFPPYIKRSIYAPVLDGQSLKEVMTWTVEQWYLWSLNKFYESKERASYLKIRNKRSKN